MVRRQYHDMDNTSGVGVLDKAAIVLSALEAGPSTLAQLVTATGLARPTAHRLAVALEHHRLVTRDLQGRFILGPRLGELAAAAGENDTEVSEFDAYATQARLAALWFAYGADEGVRRRYADHLTDYELGRADLKTVRSVYGVDPVEFGRRIDEWASK